MPYGDPFFYYKLTGLIAGDHDDGAIFITNQIDDQKVVNAGNSDSSNGDVIGIPGNTGGQSTIRSVGPVIWLDQNGKTTTNFTQKADGSDFKKGIDFGDGTRRPFGIKPGLFMLAQYDCATWSINGDSYPPSTGFPFSTGTPTTRTPTPIFYLGKPDKNGHQAILAIPLPNQPKYFSLLANGGEAVFHEPDSDDGDTSSWFTVTWNNNSSIVYSNGLLYPIVTITGGTNGTTVNIVDHDDGSITPGTFTPAANAYFFGAQASIYSDPAGDDYDGPDSVTVSPGDLFKDV